MRRATLSLSLTVIAAVSVVGAYGVLSQHSPDVKSLTGDSALVRPSIDGTRVERTRITESIDESPSHTPSGDRRLDHSADRAAMPSPIDEERSAEEVREYAVRRVPEIYSLLLDQLGLSSSERATMIAFLVEDLVSRTSTRFVQSEPMDPDDRSDMIAGIIGEAKAKEFLSLERNLDAFSEVHKVQALFERNGVTISDSQRNRLLSTIINVRSEVDAAIPRADRGDSIEHLEIYVDQLAERQRLIMELVPSFLSTTQVVLLQERYQTLHLSRAHALESQRKQLLDDPDSDPVFWMPANR